MSSDPLALAVIDAARAYRLGRSRSYNVLSGYDLDRALAAWDAARTTKQCTLADDPLAIQGPLAVYQAARELDASITGLSWGGFNVFGDQKSIKEVERIMYLESRLIALEARIRGADKTTERHTLPDGTVVLVEGGGVVV